jgi:Ca2+-transporting ATPase
MTPFYKLSTEEALRQLNSSPGGLSNDAVAPLQQQYGPNTLQEAKRKSKLGILLAQFKDIMIIILLVAAGISFTVGEITDAWVIIAIVLLNAWIGFNQEYKAEESVRMLRQMAAQHASVLRNNNPVKIDAQELVPGDVILLEAGDIVPADARLLEAHGLKTNEASLTGESHSIEKHTAPVTEDDLVPGDQLNMVFKGTIVSNGSAKAVVTATGMQTELGRIAEMLEVPDQKTPLQKRMARFSKQLAVVVVLICAVVFALGMAQGQPAFTMFLTALSLAVAALPEALPALITIALAQGARRMVTQKALMRNLPAVETLGSVTYICSDKTGTLTQNVMTVEKVECAPGKEKLLLHAMMLNNEVRFSQDSGHFGDSTETALVDYAERKGITKKQADKDFPLEKKIPFDSERMRMSTLHRHKDKWILFVKGAPRRILEVLSGAYHDQREQLLQKNRAWAAEGLRVLFFAYKEFDQYPGDITAEDEKDLEYLGMAAMIDPPRDEVIAAIRECKSAGIRSVMITGDQPLTAQAIAERLEMIDESSSHAVKTGAELDKMNEEQFRETVRNTYVYARVSPEQKLKIVKALQQDGAFVAMTGDGVNDAPSLKQSNIGVAMGITGTDVSKEAADMVLLDDNFATIVKAVKEGRRIYDNIKKFVLYVMSCNSSEILTILVAGLIGFPIPLQPIHILWINLVTDGLPGLALVAEPAEENIMNRPPRAPNESLLAEGLIPRIILAALVMTGASEFVQLWAINNGYDITVQQTMVFTTLCFVQLGNALSVRSMYRTIFSRWLFTNKGMLLTITATVALQLALVYTPVLQPIFKTTSLDSYAIAIIVTVTVLSIVCIDLMKQVYKRLWSPVG